MKVLAIDPGERCGWATGEIGPSVRQLGVTDDRQTIDFEDFSHLDVTGHGISPLKEMALKLHEVVANYDVVIYERYAISGDPAKLRAHVGSSVPTLQLVGMIRLCGWLSPTTKLVGQSPRIKRTADKWIKAKLPDVARRIDGLPKAHDESHDGDALRHLAFYYMENHT